MAAEWACKASSYPVSAPLKGSPWLLVPLRVKPQAICLACLAPQSDLSSHLSPSPPDTHFSGFLAVPNTLFPSSGERKARVSCGPSGSPEPGEWPSLTTLYSMTHCPHHPVSCFPTTPPSLVYCRSVYGLSPLPQCKLKRPGALLGSLLCPWLCGSCWAHTRCPETVLKAEGC